MRDEDKIKNRKSEFSFKAPHSTKNLSQEIILMKKTFYESRYPLQMYLWELEGGDRGRRSRKCQHIKTLGNLNDPVDAQHPLPHCPQGQCLQVPAISPQGRVVLAAQIFILFFL